MATLHVRLDFAVSKSPLEPSSALHEVSEKRPKKAPKSAKICVMCTNTPKPSTGRILGYVAQIPIPRAPSPPATRHFLWFPSLRIAQRATETPHTNGHLVEPEGIVARARGGGGGATVGPPGSPGLKKIIFPQLFRDHLGCSNKCFYPVLSSW